MRSKQIRRVPVLDANRQLVGILSLADVARRARRMPDIRPEEVAIVLADICQPPSSPPHVSA
jgi:CBS-domain-containing membrane protein